MALRLIYGVMYAVIYDVIYDHIYVINDVLYDVIDAVIYGVIYEVLHGGLTQGGGVQEAVPVPGGGQGKQLLTAGAHGGPPVQTSFTRKGSA